MRDPEVGKQETGQVGRGFGIPTCHLPQPTIGTRSGIKGLGLG